MNRRIENTSSQNDPGDDTLKRYRYQCTYAALLSIGIIKESTIINKVYCEHHEDVLIKLSNGKFSGIQIKTRNLNLGAFDANDEAIVKSTKRFIELDIQFPNQFQSFVLATNVGFLKKENAKGLDFILTQLKENKAISNGNIKKWIKKFATQLGTTEAIVKSVLKKINLKSDIGSIETIDVTLLRELGELKQLDDATYAELKSITDKLILHHINASSLKYRDPLHEHFVLNTNPEKEEAKEKITGKSIDEGIVLGIIDEVLTDKVKIHLKDNMPTDLSSTKKLEIKLDAGGVSYDNLELLKDNKSSMEFKLASWIHKYSEKTARERYNQIKTIVQTECQNAHDTNITGDEDMTKPTNGTKMLIQIRKELKDRYKSDKTSFFDCIPEHLYGMAAILTEECKIWWSEKFKID